MADLVNQQAHPDDIARELNVQAALMLRMQGHGYAAIGKAISVSKATAFRMVTGALAELAHQTRETTEEYRALELARLDDMWRRLYPSLPNQKLDINQARVLLRLSMQRAALLGLPVVRALPMGDEIPVEGDVDLERLPIAELRLLEGLVLKAQGKEAPVLALDPADEIFEDVTPAPTTEP